MTGPEEGAGHQGAGPETEGSGVTGADGRETRRADAPARWRSVG
jgi:hypothetical protein